MSPRKRLGRFRVSLMCINDFRTSVVMGQRAYLEMIGSSSFLWRLEVDVFSVRYGNTVNCSCLQYGSRPFVFRVINCDGVRDSFIAIRIVNIRPVDGTVFGKVAQRVEEHAVVEFS